MSQDAVEGQAITWQGDITMRGIRLDAEGGNAREIELEPQVDVGAAWRAPAYPVVGRRWGPVDPEPAVTEHKILNDFQIEALEAGNEIQLNSRQRRIVDPDAPGATFTDAVNQASQSMARFAEGLQLPVTVLATEVRGDQVHVNAEISNQAAAEWTRHQMRGLDITNDWADEAAHNVEAEQDRHATLFEDLRTVVDNHLQDRRLHMTSGRVAGYLVELLDRLEGQL